MSLTSPSVHSAVNGSSTTTMANHAASLTTELREMVRRPKSVWPGLLKHNLQQKLIPGDGNCLFASLSDQLYGTPDKHSEIRHKVIDHMRNLRPLFEAYVQTDDVQTRRALRSTTATIRNESDDAFEDYLKLMSRMGTYGGEPELVAFCQAFNQDVAVHLPRAQSYDKDFIKYTNEYRGDGSCPPTLHICYGGNEETRAHYNSARNRDGSHPRSQNSPRPESQEIRRTSIPITTLLHSNSTPPPSARALRHDKTDTSSDFMFIGKEYRHDMINRARSPSISSSHRSSSSKRSLEDDGEHHRHTKRADRRRSTRKITDLTTTSVDSDADIPLHLHIGTHPTTPTSTQDTENSSEPFEPEPSIVGDVDSTSSQYEDESDGEPIQRRRKVQSKSRVPKITTNLVNRPRSTVRT